MARRHTRNKMTATAAAEDEGYIYVLRCADVGRSRDVLHRIDEHANEDGDEKGAAWTKLHAPLKLVYCHAIQTVHDEDNKTLELMQKHGIDVVRGGTFCRVELPRYQRQTIGDMINTSKCACFNCGGTGHVSKDCDWSSGRSKSSFSYASYVRSTSRPRPRHCCEKKEPRERDRERDYRN
jgi:predicted GIY-YIG superfamily endonuclease